MIRLDMNHNPVLSDKKSLSSAHARAELERFLEALFQAEDLIELRLIDSKTKKQRDGSSLIERRWLNSSELLNDTPRLTRKNAKGVHIYFGVNPRSQRSGVKDSVHTCRVIWADIDNVSIFSVAQRWRGRLPEPSIVVDSGHGAHLYWLLDQPADVSTLEKREKFESSLLGLYKVLGADATQDVSRLLRLPGFTNVKSSPAPCRLVRCHAEKRYPLSLFEKWRPESKDVGCETLRCEQLSPTQDSQRIRGLIHYLQDEVDDRSRRDFGVVCQLLRLGLEPEEIWRLVEPHSKFATDGRAYFELTLKNANDLTCH